MVLNDGLHLLGLNLVSRDIVNTATFIKLKPTFFYLTYAIAILSMKLGIDFNIISTIYGKKLNIPSSVWYKYLLKLSDLCITLAGLNALIALTVSVDIWINFTYFFALPLLFIGIYIATKRISKLIIFNHKLNDHSNRTSSNSYDVTSGKWMVGIGLGIGLLVIVQVNSTKSKSHIPVAAPIWQSPTTIVSPLLAAAPSLTQEKPGHAIFDPRAAATESVYVLGQQVMFSNPNGYCTPGTSERELKLMELARRSLGKGSRLVHTAVRCSELEEYRKGQRELLDHWLQIQLIGPKGDFRRIEMQRELFLSGLSNSSPRVNPEEINQRLRASLDNRDVTLSQMQFESIGRDGNAVYYSMRMNMSAAGSSRLITGIGAITLLNTLPLLVNVYEGTGLLTSRNQLQSVQQELLNSLLIEN